LLKRKHDFNRENLLIKLYDISADSPMAWFFLFSLHPVGHALPWCALNEKTPPILRAQVYDLICLGRTGNTREMS
jgi:hypothetical protein